MVPKYLENKKISEQYGGPAMTITAGVSRNNTVNKLFKKEDDQHAYELTQGVMKNKITIKKDLN